MRTSEPSLTEPPLIRSSRRFRLGLLLALGLILLFALSDTGSGRASQVEEGQMRVVELIESTQTRSIPTVATTVGGFLDRLGIAVSPDDLITPSLDTELEGNNPVVVINRARPVRVIDGSQRRVIKSALADPRAIVERADYELGNEDQVVWLDSVDEGDAIVLLPTIHIVHPTTYTLAVGTRRVDLTSSATTVAEILAENLIEFGPNYQVYPGLNTNLQPGSVITLVEKPNFIDVAADSYDLKSVSEGVYSLPAGQRVVVDQGRSRQVEIVYRVSVVAGREVNREVITRRIIDPGQPRREQYGISRTWSAATSIPKSERAELLTAVGINQSDWDYASYIIEKESTWRPGAMNPSSGAYGLCQSLPANKMASAGSDWRTNPVTQLKWCHSYAQKRYKGWYHAYNFWLRNHWW